jgi:tight adherence protein C
MTTIVLASGMMGGAVFGLTWWLLAALASDDLAQGDQWRYDVTRINELRRHDALYRLLYPLFPPLARLHRAIFAPALPEVQRELQAAGLPRFWLPEEYLARCTLIALLLTPVYVYLGVDFMGTPGAVFALVLSALTAWLLRRRLHNLARARLAAIKRRMPFVLDLLTLLMEAGATFLKALEEAVHEFRGQPVAAEFARVLADIHLGRTRAEAFLAMRDRLQDSDITSIIGSIIQGESLGTPLAQVFRMQADVLRIKRSQRAETVASEAGVNMLLPGILVMMAAVLVILGPFVLNYLAFGLGF